ncbi:MAG TPA: hypothetical protein VFG34_05430 [Sphingopyxis sp.]|nr:hypothetical protein [Sphingopyxis sp.]
MTRPGKRQVDLFLDALAETSNVTASARAAGMAASAFYRERRRSADFADRWHDALCEGFVRLETELLSEALVAATGNVKDATLRARAQKYRLGLALLAAHRAAVRGTKSLAVGSSAGSVDAKDRLARRLRDMQDRASEAELPSGAEAGAEEAVGAAMEAEPNRAAEQDRCA